MLGKWKANEGVKMSCVEGHFWKVEGLQLPDNATIKYKVVKVKRGGEEQWERGDNRKLQLDQQPLAVDMRWNATHNGSITPLPTENILSTVTDDFSPRNGDVDIIPVSWQHISRGRCGC